MGRKRKSEVDSAGSLESSNSSGNNLNGLQRLAANDRERTRMRVLSKAFVRLKTSLPWVPSDTKLSKLDTLKLAASYISYLTRILGQDDENGSSNSSNSNSSSSSCSDELASVYFQPPSYHNHHHHHQSAAASSNTTTTTKMLPSIRLSAFDMQRIINNHLSCSSPSSSNNFGYHGGGGSGVGVGDGFQTASISNTTTNGSLMSHHHHHHHNMYHHSNHLPTNTSYI